MGWAPQAWALSLFAAGLLLGWPVPGHAQTVVGTVGVGKDPREAVVNPVTNKIYVTSCTGNNLTVIDGATNITTPVVTGNCPIAEALNPVTNKIYVANAGSNDVTVIDGATNTTTTVAVDRTPLAVAVNPVTNKIYVANEASNNVTVIDGATNRPPRGGRHGSRCRGREPGDQQDLCRQFRQHRDGD